MRAENLTFSQHWFVLIMLSLWGSLWGYSFGTSDHLEHLPVLYRLLDGSYLPNDEFVNANTHGYNPRTLFMYCVLPFCYILGVPLAYWLGVFVTNLTIAKASYDAALHLFPRWATSGYWAAVLVLLVNTVAVGETEFLRSDFFIPSAAASGLVFWAILHALRGNVWAVAWLLGLGSLIHPLLCPLSGGILFGIMAIRSITTYKTDWQKYRSLLIAGAVWLGLVGIILLPYILENLAVAKISNDDFVRIYAHFRNPHHFLASQFLTPDETTRAWRWLGILAMSFVAARWLMREQRGAWWFLLALVAILLGLLPLGYYFVEIQPSRLWATIQIFRFLFVIKWLVLVLLAGVVAYAWQRWRLAALGLLATFYYPLATLGGLTMLGIATFFQNKFTFVRRLAWLGLAICAGIGIYKTWSVVLPELPRVYLYALWVFLLAVWLEWRKLGAVLIGLLSIVFAANWWQTPRTPSDTPLQQAIHHQRTLAELPSAMQPLATFLRAHTPDTAILLTPPRLAELRLTARRAIVADFKTLPFEDAALLRWYNTLIDIYGQTDKVGFEAVQWSFVPNYQYFEEGHFHRKARQYGASYIVLLAETPTHEPILYQDSLYKVIRARWDWH